MRSCPHCLSPYSAAVEFCGIDGTRLQEFEADPLVGTDIDRYSIQAVLGDGAMARVYRATHRVLDREYAVKVLFGEIAGNKTLSERFRREAQVISKIDHPNVVSVIDFGSTDKGLTFLTMELILGRTLRETIKADGAFSAERAGAIARQIALGLADAHQRGFVHRDLKPSNIMIVQDQASERVKILDFGLARVTDADNEDGLLTRTGQFLGTPVYMAPEQIIGADVTPAADLYALGIVLYEMLEGRPPFRAKKLAEIRKKHLTEPPPEARPSRGLEELVRDLLAKNAGERPASAREVISRIDALGLSTWERAEITVRQKIPELPHPPAEVPEELEAAAALDDEAKNVTTRLPIDVVPEPRLLVPVTPTDPRDVTTPGFVHGSPETTEENAGELVRKVAGAEDWSAPKEPAGATPVPLPRHDTPPSGKWKAVEHTAVAPAPRATLDRSLVDSQDAIDPSVSIHQHAARPRTFVIAGLAIGLLAGVFAWRSISSPSAQSAVVIAPAVEDAPAKAPVAPAPEDRDPPARVEAPAAVVEAEVVRSADARAVVAVDRVEQAAVRDPIERDAPSEREPRAARIARANAPKPSRATKAAPEASGRIDNRPASAAAPRRDPAPETPAPAAVPLDAAIVRELARRGLGPDDLPALTDTADELERWKLAAGAKNAAVLPTAQAALLLAIRSSNLDPRILRKKLDRASKSLQVLSSSIPLLELRPLEDRYLALEKAWKPALAPADTGKLVVDAARLIQDIETAARPKR